MALAIGLEQAEVVAELPPRPKRKGGHGRSPSKQYVNLVNFLKEHKGELVKIGSAEKRLQAQALAFRIRKGKSAAFKPEGAFTAETRFNAETGHTDVYVRYVGEEGLPTEEDQEAADVEDQYEDDESEDDEWGDGDE